MLTNKFNWLWALVICALLSTSYMLDGPDDLQTENAIAQDVLDARNAAAQDLRTDRAAHQFCVKAKGIHSVHRWDINGNLVCTDGQNKQATTPVGVRT